MYMNYNSSSDFIIAHQPACSLESLLVISWATANSIFRIHIEQYFRLIDGSLWYLVIMVK